MRVQQHTDSGVILGGIPHGAAWMTFAVLLGLVFAGVAVALTWYAATSGEWGILAAAMFSFLFGLLFLGFGLDKLLSVEHLELKREGPCRYLRRSRLLGERERIEFDASSVHSVAISISEEWRERPSETTGRIVERLEANLLLTRPRRKIELDVTENGRADRVLRIASEVAAAMDIPLTDERGRTLPLASASADPVEVALRDPETPARKGSRGRAGGSGPRLV